MAIRKKLRVFIMEPDAGEPSTYAGTVPEMDQWTDDARTELVVGIGNVVLGLIDDLLAGKRTALGLHVYVERMTDKAVRELPECG